MTAHVPEEHSSLVGGSTAARRIGCAASYQLEQLVPKDEAGSSYAREGTALHEIMARVISDGVEPTSLLPFVYTAPAAKGGWTYTITSDIWDQHGEPALRAFDDFCASEELRLGHDMQMVSEVRVEFPSLPGAFGTTDVVMRCGPVRYILDWKFGYNEVSPVENKQLLFYAAAVLHDETTKALDFMFGADDDDVVQEVQLAIVQPAVSKQVQVWVTDAQTVDAFMGELLLAVAAAQLPGAETKATPGDWCRYARCKTVCPAHIGASQRLGEKLAALQAERHDPVPAGHNEPPEIDWPTRYAELLDLAELAEKLSAEVFAQAHAAAEGGMVIPGWGLDAKRPGHRKWAADEARVKRWLMRAGLKAAEYAPRQLVTPATADRLLAAREKTLLADLVAPGVSSGTTLKRTEKVKRPQQSPATRLAELGAKLNQLGGQ